MSSRLIAIGDIHGCSQALSTLLTAIAPQAGDTIVTLGDYVDRGPDSSAVLEQLVELAGKCHLVPLLGNHEIMMLSASGSAEEQRFWTSCGGLATLASYGGDLANVPAAHLMFLNHCQKSFETDEYFFIHANYDSEVDVSETIDQIAYWEHITGAIPPPHVNGKVGVVGHTPQVDGMVHDHGHLIMLDTYCFGGMWLTALELNHGFMWQANEAGELIEEDISGA